MENAIYTSIVGNWTLSFIWNFQQPGYQNYGTLPITFNADGTFSIVAGDNIITGPWAQISGMLMFNIGNGTAIYAGNWTNNAITGTMSQFNGTDAGNGVFIMLQGPEVPPGITNTQQAEKSAKVGVDGRK
jgi:hypothetical protein